MSATKKPKRTPRPAGPPRTLDDLTVKKGIAK